MSNSLIRVRLVNLAEPSVSDTGLVVREGSEVVCEYTLFVQTTRVRLNRLSRAVHDYFDEVVFGLYLDGYCVSGPPSKALLIEYETDGVTQFGMGSELSLSQAGFDILTGRLATLSEVPGHGA